MKKINIMLLLMTIATTTFAQRNYWQQQANYTIDVRLNTENHQFDGKQTLEYTNNSPDTLNTVFYHLYFNAFQPGSAMDVRSRTIADPDRRVGDRISKLQPHEYGWQKVETLTQNGKALKTKVDGTIMKVTLAEPILPNTTHEFKMTWKGQVPKQIRRSGRDNKEGVDYSMTQWFPKIAEYDYKGWHAYEYVGREFHSPWGDYNVTLHLPTEYVVGATGVLQNNKEVGHGYDCKEQKPKQKTDYTTWQFKADNVIDFAWVADPEFTHKWKQVPNGPEVHFLYFENDKTKANWERMIKEYTVPLFETMSEKFGEYPYPIYTVAQGGDGGMEYPLITLITGERNYDSLTGVTAHELAHSWFQMMMATNEALYPWMDEGMTSFAEAEVNHVIRGEEHNAHSDAYKSYKRHIESGLNEPGNQHADHFHTNYAYSITAYIKGELLLAQLRYMMGEETFHKAMHRYYNEWRYKHPEPNDFMRIMEKESGLQLQWFLRDWINTTRTIDYAVQSVSNTGVETTIVLENKGLIPMPTEVTVEYTNGHKELFYIPLNELYGEKQFAKNENITTLPTWNWVAPTYEFQFSTNGDIKSVTIDAQNQTADINRENNSWK